MPLNLLDFINSLAEKPQPAPVASVDPTPVPGATPGAAEQSSSPLGTVLATLRRNGPGPRSRAMLGGNQKPAPSKGGAIAQGFMQAMDNAKDYDSQQAKLQQVLDAFNYKKAKDQLDQAYKEKQDAIRNQQADERMKIWRTSSKGKAPDPLLVETRRQTLLEKDPDYKRLASDDEQAPGLRMSPDERKALELRVAQRKKEIWALGSNADEDEEATPAPAAAPAATAPEPAAVPMPPQRPADLGAQPAPQPMPAPAPPAPAPAPAPRVAPVKRAPSAAAIEALKANPDKADEFDQYFGPGAAASVFGMPPPVPNFGGN